MLFITPIQSIETTKELCNLCNCDIIPNSLSYSASELNDETKEFKHYIGICQFTIHNNEGIIHTLKNVNELKDVEALQIMARAVTNFIYRCGIEDCYINLSSVSENLSNLLSFSKKDTSRSYLNLKKYYESPCKYTKD